MPSTDQLDRFRDIVFLPIDYHIEKTNGDVLTLLKFNSIGFGNLVGEARRNFEEYQESRKKSSLFFSTLVRKVKEIKDSLFKTTDLGIEYIPTEVLINEIGKPQESYPFHIYQFILNVSKMYSEYLEEDNNVKIFSIQAPKSHKKKGKRRPSRQSFQLTNPKETNLNAAHLILSGEKNNFIAVNTPFVNFEQVFSGEPVAETNKVVWEETNALRYFIRELIKKKAVISPNEGRWERTIKCFKKSYREFEVKDFSKTHNPVDTITLILDDAIKKFKGLS